MEDILVDNMLVQAAGSSSKAGRLVAHGLSMDFKQARRARNIPETCARRCGRQEREATSYHQLRDTNELL
ncbi:hypothetical protein [Arcanobacterium haemolyticum]